MRALTTITAFFAAALGTVACSPPSDIRWDAGLEDAALGMPYSTHASPSFEADGGLSEGPCLDGARRACAGDPAHDQPAHIQYCVDGLWSACPEPEEGV